MDKPNITQPEVEETQIIKTSWTFKEIFDTLSAIPTKDLREKKLGLDYISWALAYKEVTKLFEVNYEIVKFDDKPFQRLEEGYMVYTRVTIMGITKEMFLPVMDFRNQAVKTANMMEINKTIMRCFVKTLALFGFGIDLYTGEDLPEDDKDAKGIPNKNKKDLPPPSAKTPSLKEGWIKNINICDNIDKLNNSLSVLDKMEEKKLSLKDKKELTELIAKKIEDIQQKVVIDDINNENKVGNN